VSFAWAKVRLSAVAFFIFHALAETHKKELQQMP